MGFGIGLALSSVIGSFVPYIYVLRDEFIDTLTAGNVDATDAVPGPGTRAVKDTETKIQIINNTARLSGMTTKAWNREGLYYGPFDRVTGRTLALFIKSLDVMVDGSGAPTFMAGYFPDQLPADPTTGQYGWGVENNGVQAAMLNINLKTAITEYFKSIKQVEFLLLVAMRENGVIYYITASPDARNVGLVNYPNIRPIGIFNSGTAALYAGMWSLGHITELLRSIAISDIVAWENWYISAAIADSLVGTGAIDGVDDELGNTWANTVGTITKTANGAVGAAGGINLAAIITTNPIGLISATFKVGTTPKDIYIYFRMVDGDNQYYVRLTSTAFRFRKRVDGVNTDVDSGAWSISADTDYHLQVIDDGSRIRMLLNGVDLGNVDGYTHTELAGTSKCGFAIAADGENNVEVVDFEAHDFSIAIPGALKLGSPYATLGRVAVATEDFAGVTADMDGKTTTTGNLVWRADSGRIDLDGSGQGVYTSGDAIYTIPWTSTAFADLEVKLTPPGVGYSSGDDCFAGLVFWEDASNHLAIRFLVADSQVGTSEIEILHTVATVGTIIQRVALSTEIAHGDQDTLRATFDGNHYVAYLDGEPVISQKLTDRDTAAVTLIINRIGLYGASVDTGTKFDDFTALS